MVFICFIMKDTKTECSEAFIRNMNFFLTNSPFTYTKIPQVEQYQMWDTSEYTIYTGSEIEYLCYFIHDNYKKVNSYLFSTSILN